MTDEEARSAIWDVFDAKGANRIRISRRAGRCCLDYLVGDGSRKELFSEDNWELVFGLACAREVLGS